MLYITYTLHPYYETIKYFYPEFITLACYFNTVKPILCLLVTLEMISLCKSAYTAYLLSPGREPRVSTDTTFDVQITLSMPAQVDGAGRDVDIHKVVNNSALYVVLNPVHQVPPPHIYDLNERKVPEHTKKQRTCEIDRFIA